MTRENLILGLESSCDDTAAAILRVAPGESCAEICATITSSQDSLHAAFGGVVPEVAARAHSERLDGVTQLALDQAGIALSRIDAIAVTAGPGLIGGVMAGVMFAKGLSAGMGCPLYGINHLAGHALTPRLVEDIAFPYLMLLVSGGHCQFLVVEGPLRFRRLGGTIDDAPGEAFDKIARHLSLPAPGGPAIETEAKHGDATRFALPRPLLDRDDCNLSFSGLKTAARRVCDMLVTQKGGLSQQDRADLCAGFQAAVVDVLAEKTHRACELVATRYGATTLAVAGGVAANAAIRSALKNVASEAGFGWVAPPLSLCTDNAAMIAFAASDQMPLRAPDGLDLVARPRWPLDLDATPMLGAGRKGPKA